MDLGLRGHVAIVTGSSRGIGRAIALSLAEEGARLVINARGSEALAVVAVVADVTTPTGCQRVFDATVERFGQVDVLVNNVGGGGATSLAAPDEDWLAAFDLTFWPA